MGGICPVGHSFPTLVLAHGLYVLRWVLNLCNPWMSGVHQRDWIKKSSMRVHFSLGAVCWADEGINSGKKTKCARSQGEELDFLRHSITFHLTRLRQKAKHTSPFKESPALGSTGKCLFQWLGILSSCSWNSILVERAADPNTRPRREENRSLTCLPRKKVL